jgi:predicted small integral membrane protein
MCNGFSIALSLSTLFGVIILVFSIVAVLDIVVPVLRNPRCSIANFATREPGCHPFLQLLLSAYLSLLLAWCAALARGACVLIAIRLIPRSGGPV